MEQTKNLHLWLPSDTDPLAVDKLSENFDKLDEAVADVISPFKVGDILTTLRTDLGDDWLLCNGDPLDAQKYPELAGLMPGLEVSVNAATVTTVGSPLSSSCYADSLTADGTTQLVTTSIGRSTRTANYLIQSNDNFKTHTSVSTFTGTYARPFFANGYWIIFFFDITNSNPPTTRASYISAGDRPGGTRVQFPTNINIADVHHVEYIDGKYYAFCTEATAYKAVVLTSDSPDFANATVSYANNASYLSNSYPYSFLRTEDKFVFFRNVGSKLYSVTWSDKPASGYQTRTVDQAGQTDAGAGARAFQGYGKPLYADGKVFWVGTSGSSPSRKITVICLEGIESGGIRYVDVGDTKNADCSACIFRLSPDEYAIFWYDSASDSYLMVGTDPLDASTWKKCSLGTKGVGVNYQCLQYIGGGCLNAFTADGKLVSVPIASAPKISLSGCYAYIKAK